MRISNGDRDRLFGRRGHVNKISVRTPWGIYAQVNIHILDVFIAACAEAFKDQWKPKRIDSYNFRPIRDSLKPSLHGWAMAWDFFATPPNVPPPGGVWHPDNPVTPSFAACFTKYGFTWGANYSRRKDYPHIEWAGGLPGKVQIPIPTPEEANKMVKGAIKLEVTPSGKGYWIFASDGGVFSFGDAQFHGSSAGSKSTFVDACMTPTGEGYYLLAADGKLSPHGDAEPYKDGKGKVNAADYLK